MKATRRVFISVSALLNNFCTHNEAVECSGRDHGVIAPVLKVMVGALGSDCSAVRPDTAFTIIKVILAHNIIINILKKICAYKIFLESHRHFLITFLISSYLKVNQLILSCIFWYYIIVTLHMKYFQALTNIGHAAMEATPVLTSCVWNAILPMKMRVAAILAFERFPCEAIKVLV